MSLKHSEVTDIIIRSFYEAYNELGTGFLESIYQEAMVVVLREAGLSVEAEYDLPVSFRGQIIGQFRADLLVERKVIIELKAARNIERVFEAQVINYLKASGLEVGLLLNFGPKAEFKRIVREHSRENPRSSA
ncbi:MAG: GxxExxY protein [Betaproteobacteria bacterium RBG_16_64_9]|nr:MAG: GxxExxY protein [Betaproteobacteria bacterium RBG_16_64_9]